MAGIEEVAKSWLVDPGWQRVFKHSFDVLEDYVAYVLITVGAITLSVRLLTTVASGDVVCILIGVENGTKNELYPYAVGGTLGMINYAQTEQGCISAVYTKFMEYLPYIMLLQTLVLVIVEKFTFKIPRITQKVERFYKNIVEESLFGKDPDVAEDMTDPKTSTEAISRRRQRIEICISLKRSSFLFNVYIAKNIVEIIAVAIFLPVNVNYALLMKETSAQCKIPVQAFPAIIPEPGVVHFQCHGKKNQFFTFTLWGQSALLALHAIMSVGCLIWTWRFRAVTNLINTIDTLNHAWEEPVVKRHDGKDFLFLFDLLSHSCGLEATLRVLTHSDDNFYTICKPKFRVESGLQREEDKLKIIWQPADIEKWLFEGVKKGKAQRSISFDSYQVTLFPAESIKNTQTIPIVKDDDAHSQGNGEIKYSTWFYDLAGGKTEYVITIACIIGKSRMKGEKIVTNLVPYGPEKPKSGMVKSIGTHQVEVFWDPPKAEFTKYEMVIEKISDALNFNLSSQSIIRMISIENSNQVNSVDGADKIEFDNSNVRHVENLSSMLTSYTILGLSPGEKYRVTLGTKTGTVSTRQPISEEVVTKPLPVTGLMINDITAVSCIVHWLPPRDHSCLKGFQIEVQHFDGKIVKSVAVNKNKKSFEIKDLSPNHDYNIFLTTLCMYNSIRTESVPTSVSFSSLLESIKNLRLECATPNSILVKWDPPLIRGQNMRQRLSIEGIEVDYTNFTDLTADEKQYNFTNLPEIEGSGKKYRVSIFALSGPSATEHEVESKAVEETFCTLPLEPTNLKFDGNEIHWTKSLTPNISEYKVQWETMENPVRSYKNIVPVEEGEDEEQKLTLHSLEDGISYNLNIYAVVTLDDVKVESKELHATFIRNSSSEGLIRIEK